MTADCQEIPLVDLEAAHADGALGLDTGFDRFLAKMAFMQRQCVVADTFRDALKALS